MKYSIDNNRLLLRSGSVQIQPQFNDYRTQRELRRPAKERFCGTPLGAACTPEA